MMPVLLAKYYRLLLRFKRRRRDAAIVEAYKDHGHLFDVAANTQLLSRLEMVLRATMDIELYLDLHPDVRAAGASISVHYINHGIKDGRALLKDDLSQNISMDEWIGRRV